MTGAGGETGTWTALACRLRSLREHLGRPVPFWLRDDDAVAPSAALDRLVALAEAAGMPLALAVIPADLQPALAERLADARGVSVLQHGFAHRDHAAPGLKKCEFGGERPLALRCREIAEGRARLAGLPGFVPVFVPPWNRLGADLLPALPGLGLGVLSRFGDRAAAAPAAGLAEINTHLDPIDWRGTRGLRGEAACLADLVARCDRLRAGTADADEPTGILTHHRIQDAATFVFLGKLLSFLADTGHCVFVSIRDGLETTAHGEAKSSCLTSCASRIWQSSSRPWPARRGP